LHRFGNLEELIKKSGFKINHILESHIEGENLSTMVRSTALSMLHMPEIFKKLKPDMVLTVGPSMQKLLQSKIENQKDKVKFIFNGFDETKIAKAKVIAN
jgi:UDP-N-acetylglucosamine 2-epimerase